MGKSVDSRVEREAEAEHAAVEQASQKAILAADLAAAEKKIEQLRFVSETNDEAYLSQLEYEQKLRGTTEGELKQARRAIRTVLDLRGSDSGKLLVGNLQAREILEVALSSSGGEQPEGEPKTDAELTWADMDIARREGFEEGVAHAKVSPSLRETLTPEEAGRIVGEAAFVRKFGSPPVEAQWAMERRVHTSTFNRTRHSLQSTIDDLATNGIGVEFFRLSSSSEDRDG